MLNEDRRELKGLGTALFIYMFHLFLVMCFILKIKKCVLFLHFKIFKRFCGSGDAIWGHFYACALALSWILTPGLQFR